MLTYQTQVPDIIFNIIVIARRNEVMQQLGPARPPPSIRKQHPARCVEPCFSPLSIQSYEQKMLRPAQQLNEAARFSPTFAAMPALILTKIVTWACLLCHLRNGTARSTLLNTSTPRTVTTKPAHFSGVYLADTDSQPNEVRNIQFVMDFSVLNVELLAAEVRFVISAAAALRRSAKTAYSACIKPCVGDELTWQSQPRESSKGDCGVVVENGLTTTFSTGSRIAHSSTPQPPWLPITTRPLVWTRRRIISCNTQQLADRKQPTAVQSTPRMAFSGKSDQSLARSSPSETRTRLRVQPATQDTGAGQNCACSP
ncbi:hypothetical protein SS50377_21405 [Spironucleus salmonicida]|uniref:Uncharacterized protein n=1 Tax=Spironucleus salmonicida TaxID=348837 RepID=A0A9P8LX59_9EUKA|nr:hypothetical protein SS50377_21405 [Spironucleus salmonicida]